MKKIIREIIFTLERALLKYWEGMGDEGTWCRDGPRSGWDAAGEFAGERLAWGGIWRMVPARGCWGVAMGTAELGEPVAAPRGPQVLQTWQVLGCVGAGYRNNRNTEITINNV